MVTFQLEAVLMVGYGEEDEVHANDVYLDSSKRLLLLGYNV